MSKLLFTLLVILFVSTYAACRTVSCNNRIGPSNKRASSDSSSSFYTVKKALCRICTVDCASFWVFSKNYNTNWLNDDDNKETQFPTNSQVVSSTTCTCPYYNYGCQANTHCLSYSSYDEMLTAIGFCMIHNGCKLHASIDSTSFNSTVAKFAHVSPVALSRATFATNMNKKTTKLMKQESKILKELGVRASIIYHFKRIQDIKDAIMLNIGYDQYASSPNGDWALENIPPFVNASLQAYPVSRKLFERVKSKLTNDKFPLPEDKVLYKVRDHATTQLKLMDAISKHYATLKRESINVVAKIKAGYRLGHAHYDLLENEIESLRLAIQLTRESDEEEARFKSMIEAEIKRRVADNAKLAEISVFKLFLGRSWKEREEALKKLASLLKKELEAKTKKYLDRIAGKMTETGRAIKKEFSKDGKMAKGLKKAEKGLKKAGSSIRRAFRL